MITTHQYRIYPTRKQRLTLESNLEACRNLYNQALDQRKAVYETTGVGLTYLAQANQLTPFRQEFPFWASLHTDILQDTLRRLDKAYKAFFRRVKNRENPGYPRFKGKGRYRSLTYSHLAKTLIIPTQGHLARLVVPKIGQVKIRLHRPLPDGVIKTLQIVRKASGWYANITIEIDDVAKVDIQSLVGVDVGLESFLTTSDGEKVENPRHLKISLRLLKRLQRRLSKRIKGSRRRAKIRERIAKLHERIVNQRRDFHYKTAHRLYSQYDAVAVEELTIANMVQNHHLAQSISDAAWGHFVQALGSKAENAGCHLLFVSPNGTTQKCSGCGETVKKSLAVRIHHCDSCGLVLDRDHNAAINIKGVASTLRGGVAVVNAPVTLSIERKSRESRKTLDGRVLQQASPFRAG